MVYDGGPSVHEVAEQAARFYLHENALNTKAFPRSARSSPRSSVGRPGSCTATTVAGFLTSGGTESILCGVLAARERAAAERGITEPEMVVAESAHAAFHKAAHNFGLKLHKAPVKDDWTADVDAMAALCNENTVLVVGSAPQYPQGVQDDIPAIAALAASSIGANCHVDACMGGFVLPFAEMLGREVKPWDFRVDGVTTISADIHKLGYAPKGVSVILHRNKASRAYQTFVFDDWLGGFYASPNMQGTRSGLPMACAWAVMSHLGIDGYVDLTRQTLANADAFRAGVAAIDGIRVLGDGRFHLVAMASDPDVRAGDRHVRAR
jgi:sphinganine-1-phosphate aldolase